MGDIAIRKPGLYTTVQDRGRFGYQALGIPASGVMDTYSYQMANSLLGNEGSEAVLEATITGPEIEFRANTEIALAGGDMSPRLNGHPLEMWRTVAVGIGDVLDFGELRSGCRTYIGFKGGIDVPIVMGSRSTYVRGRLGGHMGRRLEAGDTLKVRSLKKEKLGRGDRFLMTKHVPDYPGDITVRVIMGPQADRFTERGIETFLSGEYACTTQNDRMGYRLSGSPIETISGSDIVSDGIAFGAIQVTNGGEPVIMMADRQTVGGYAKIACVISDDLPKVAQAKAGDRIRFSVLSDY